MRRLDIALVERGLAQSRNQAQVLIGGGMVRLDGRRADKADQAVVASTLLEVVSRPPFVSRGGDKLSPVLARLGVDPQNRVCLDVGASTGGFTDVLLKAGARLVYAVDVGYGQLDWRLRQDARVRVMERTNIRTLTALDGPTPDLAVVDLSFISLRATLPAIAGLLRPAGDMVALFKPQFEVGRGRVGKGGVVRDTATRDAALRGFVEWAQSTGFDVVASEPSPVPGARGNQEIFVHLRRPGRHGS